VAQFQAGDPAAAEASVLKLPEYDTDQETARRLLSEIRPRGDRFNDPHQESPCF